MAKATDGAAAPAATDSESADELGLSLMAAVAHKVGLKAPAVEKDETVVDDNSANGEHSEAGDKGDAGSDAGNESGEDAGAAEDAAGSDADEGEASESDQGEDEAATKAYAADTAKLINAKLKDLPTEVRQKVQSVIDARMGAITAKERAKYDKLATRNDELENELAEAKKSGGSPVNVPGVHPLFLAPSEAAVDAREEEIEKFEDWAADHPEGFNLEDSENYDPKQPSYTAAQISSRLRELNRERSRIIPAVRANFQKRAALDADVKKALPSLFDRKSDDYATAQAILKAQPELRRHADMNVLIARQILGEKALAALVKGTTAPAKSVIAPKKAPRVPGSGGAAKGSVVAGNRDQAANLEASKKLSSAKGIRDIQKAVELMVGTG